MKLSLSWIFDHIEGSWTHLDIPELINRINKTVVEIEDCRYYSIDITLFTAALVREINKDVIKVYSPELLEEYTLSVRDDVAVGDVYLIKKHERAWEWAQGKDFQSEKEGFVPALAMTDEQLRGSWKNNVEEDDYILTVGNVTITHRPDLWSHRGFAREIAALLDLPLKPLEQFLADINVRSYDHSYKATPEANFSLMIRDEQSCKRLAAFFIPEVEQEGSWFWMVYRLLRIDSRASNPYVDTSNYVMFDIGQPMHVFDADMVEKHELIVRRARLNEKIVLIDGKEIELTPDNVVIADIVKPLGLIGIMGGKSSSVTQKTKSILVESAALDAKNIRKTASHFKLRTEASSRFEKSLDPNQNLIALMRFLHILDKQIKLIVDPLVIISLGKELMPHELSVAHNGIEKKLGISLVPATVREILSRLQFQVDVQGSDPVIYKIKIPTFRSRDITIADDIIEEIGRFIGFDAIVHKLPKIQTKPEDLTPLIRLDTIKQYLAFGASMHEVRNYAVFNEGFLSKIKWGPLTKETVSIVNPVSTDLHRMVTTLVPNLLKNIEDNHVGHDILNFFEFNSIFHKQNDHIYESKSLAGIFFASKSILDFYDKKHIISTLFSSLNISIQWMKAEGNLEPWYHPFKTAYIFHEHERIGIAGMANPMFLHHLWPGQAFIFELNGTFLLQCKENIKRYQQIPKYQDTWADVSMLVPLSLSADKLKKEIQESDGHIFAVQLIDFFQKDEWNDQRSVTMRYYARAHDKTLASDQIEAIHAKVVKRVEKLGAKIR